MTPDRIITDSIADRKKNRNSLLIGRRRQALHHTFRSQFGSCIKLARTLLPVCSRGWPATICRNLCKPSRRCSITSSLNRLVKTFPGSGGIVTLVLSRSRISLKYSKSEYRRRTMECLSLNAGMFVRQIISYEVNMLREVPWV